MSGPGSKLVWLMSVTCSCYGNIRGRTVAVAVVMGIEDGRSAVDPIDAVLRRRRRGT